MWDLRLKYIVEYIFSNVFREVADMQGLERMYVRAFVR